MTVEHRSKNETECSTQITAQIRMKAAGRRKHVMHGGTLCSRCLSRPPASNKVRYCRQCKTDHERQRRRKEDVA